MAIRTSFRFTLPKGIGIETEEGRKATGSMRLIQVKDLIQIERDAQVQRNSAAYYMVLLGKVITELGKEKSVTRKTIERLCTADFTFLVDFLHQINHQVLREIPAKCGSCSNEYRGVFIQLGEA
jgi:hypothetical protein